MSYIRMDIKVEDPSHCESICKRALKSYRVSKDFQTTRLRVFGAGKSSDLRNLLFKNDLRTVFYKLSSGES